MTDADKRKRTEDVIGEAKGNHAELLMAIQKLEWYANELQRAADRKRPPEHGEGGSCD